MAVLITTSRFSQAAIVQAIQPRGLSILIKRALLEGSAVSMEFGSVCYKGKVVSCRPKGSKYEARVVIPNMYERDLRVAQRFPVTEEVEICAGSLDSPVEASVIDLSTRGMGLQISTPLETCEIITVESASNVAYGVVRHCTPLQDGFFHAGVEVFHVMAKEAGTSRSEPKISAVERLLASYIEVTPVQSDVQPLS